MTHIDPNSKPSKVLAACVFLGILFWACLAVYLLMPPSPLPASAPDTQFSAERAIKHDRVTATEPHPAGSPANDRVETYIYDTLRSMGVEAEMNKSFYVEGHSVGLRNMVLARIPGTAPTKSFTMMAHYDSVPYGPGAADDGGGVISMLEVARALKAGPPLMNDIVFVFTDAEEAGMLGARAFGNHPWFKDVGVLLNFEARGNQGPSMMFETSPGNGWLIEQLAKAPGYPCASSLMYDVYKRMPFASDLNVLKPLTIQAMNVAFVDNFAQYHTKNDNPDNFSLASVQHHGSYGLGLARHFGNMPLDNIPKTPDAIYFNTLGFHLVHYPLSWGRPLAILAALTLLVAVVIGFLRKRLTISGLIGGILAFGICAVCAALFTAFLLLIVFGPAKFLGLYTKDILYLPDLRGLYQNNLYGTAFAASTVCVIALLAVFFLRFLRVENFAVGALVWWLAVLAALEVFLPGGSYLAMWPLFFSALGLGVLFLLPDCERPAPWAIAVTTLFALPGIAIFAPMYRAFLSTLMILFAPGLSLVIVLMLGLLIPQVYLITRPNRWWLPTLSGGFAALLIAFGLATGGYTPLQPRLNSVVYTLDVDTGQAFWLSSDKELDEWTSQFFPPGTEPTQLDDQQYNRRHERRHPGNKRIWKAPAPVANLTGAQIEIVSDQILGTPSATQAAPEPPASSANGNEREITLRIISPDKTACLDLSSESGARIHSAELFGKGIPGTPSPSSANGSSDHWGIGFNLFPKDGVELKLKTDADKPLALETRERLYGMPDVPGIKPRPDYMACEPNTVRRNEPLRGNHISVTRSFTFPAPAPAIP